MRARKKLDISWTDLFHGFAKSVVSRKPEIARHPLEQRWSATGNSLAALSVRSGFDLVLQCLALPKGSEILLSAITIRDMASIIEQHGLHAVPIDIHPETCSIRYDLLAAAVTSKTKALLVAHLFGSRMPMDEIILVAQHFKLFVFEDCAQAYAADGYRGHPDSDVSMFSFGPIKTATALGGAMLSFKDKDLCRTVSELQQQYPIQSKTQYRGKVIKYALIKAMTYRLPYTIFVAICRLFGASHDQIISKAVRGFSNENLLSNFRYQPCYALLSLINRRIRMYIPQQLISRIQSALAMSSYLTDISVIGRKADMHCHWLLPIQSQNAHLLVQSLWDQGFDATRGATSMLAVPAGINYRDATDAIRIMSHIVYLPIESGMRIAELQKLAAAVQRFELAYMTPLNKS